MERTTIRRTVELDCDAGALWRLVSDAAELGTWLGEDVELELRVGGRGHLVDDEGVHRQLRVTAVTDGEHLAFRWWPHGDDQAASEVVFTVEETDTGSRLVITESADGADGATDTALGGSWEARVVSLWLAVCSLARV